MAPRMRAVSMDESEIEAAEAAFDKEEEGEFDEGPQPRQRAGSSPFEKKLSVTILSKTFYGIFKLGGLVTRSSADFQVEEFKEPATDLLDMVNRYKPLKLLFNVLHPVVSCVSLIGKVQKLREGMPSSGRGQDKQGRDNHATGAQGEEILGSMFGPSGS